MYKQADHETVRTGQIHFQARWHTRQPKLILIVMLININIKINKKLSYRRGTIQRVVLINSYWRKFDWSCTNHRQMEQVLWRSEWRPKQKLQMNRRDSDKEGGQETKSRISEYWWQMTLNRGLVRVTWPTLNFGAPMISVETFKLESFSFAHR